MRYPKASLFFFVALGLLPAWADTGRDERQEWILATFHPYRQGPPRVEGITPWNED